MVIILFFMVINYDWKVADAKARFTDLIRKSEKEPQIITRHGTRVSVVLSYDSYIALKKYETEGQSLARIDHFLHLSTEFRTEGGYDLPEQNRRSRPGPDFSVE